MIPNLSRRCVLAGLASVAVCPHASAQQRTMTARQAYEAVGRNEMILLDIRSPGEWAQTGIATTALPVSMHEASFFERLKQLTKGDKSRKVALICAVGGRSHYLQALLQRRGYSNIVDVSEGMIGGVNGTGWIKSGLPIKPYQP